MSGGYGIGVRPWGYDGMVKPAGTECVCGGGGRFCMFEEGYGQAGV